LHACAGQGASGNAGPFALGGAGVGNLAGLAQLSLAF